MRNIEHTIEDGIRGRSNGAQYNENYKHFQSFTIFNDLHATKMKFTLINAKLNIPLFIEMQRLFCTYKNNKIPVLPVAFYIKMDVDYYRFSFTKIFI